MESYRPTQQDRVALLSRLAEKPKRGDQVYVLGDGTEVELDLDRFLRRIAGNWVPGRRAETKLTAAQKELVEGAPWFEEWLATHFH